jgi:hypothetical protein
MGEIFISRLTYLSNNLQIQKLGKSPIIYAGIKIFKLIMTNIYVHLRSHLSKRRNSVY